MRATDEVVPTYRHAIREFGKEYTQHPHVRFVVYSMNDVGFYC